MSIVSENKRPVFLNLTQIHFPPMALVSIGHRVTGVLIFLFLPLMLYLLHLALHSAQTFGLLDSLLHRGWFEFVIWILLSSVWFHLVAGIRHLFMDAGMGESLVVGRRSAYVVFMLSILLSIVTGVWLW